MKQSQETVLLTGSVTSTLLRFTVPIIISTLLQTAYSLVDMFIVGNFVSVADVSAVSTGSQLMSVIIAFGIGLTNGCTILIGHKIGKAEHKSLGCVICQGIYVVMTTALITCVCLLICTPLLVSVLNTPQDALVETQSYIFYCNLGVPLVFAYNLLSGVCRGFGDSKTALIAVAIACTLNLFGDLILVCGFGMGAHGAAIATMIAQFISVGLTLLILKRTKRLSITLKKQDFKPCIVQIKETIRLGLPIAIQLSISSFSFLIITSIVNNFGVMVSAAVGLSDKLTSLLMLIPLAFMQSLAVFTAQNYGANQIKRAKEGLRVGIIASLAIGIVWSYIAICHGVSLASLFSSSSDVNLQSNEYLRAYGIDIILSAFMYCLSGYLTGCGKTVFVMTTGLICAFCIRVPLFYILSQTIVPLSLFLTGLSNPLTTLAQSLLCFGYYIKINRNPLTIQNT